MDSIHCRKCISGMSLDIIVYLKTKSGLYTLPWTVSSTDITKVLDDTQTKLLETGYI
jgi:hypothetical protein